MPAVGTFVLRTHVAALRKNRPATFAAPLQQLAVQMQRRPRTAALVQVVNVLRHQQKLPGDALFKLAQRDMRGVRFRRRQRPPALVVKAPHQRRVARETFRRRHILHPVVLPQAVARAKSPQAGLRRNSRAGQDDNSPPDFFAAVAAHRFAPSGMRASVWPNITCFARSVIVSPELTSFAFA